MDKAIVEDIVDIIARPGGNHTAVQVDITGAVMVA